MLRQGGELLLEVLILLDRGALGDGRGGLALGALDGLRALGSRLALGATATATATATASSAAAAAIGIPLLGVLTGLAGLGLHALEELLLGLEVVRCTARGDSRQALAGKHDDVAGHAAIGGCGDGGQTRLAIIASVAATTLVAPIATGPAAATADPVVGLLLGHGGHGQVVLRGDPAAAAGALLDARDLGDLVEVVADLLEVRAGVAAEADDLDADAHLLHGPDGRREVAVAGHDDRDVDVLRQAHQIDHEFDVQVRLDAAVAVLPDVLADDLVAAALEEVMEVALVVVLRIQAGVRVGAHEVAARSGRLEERDVVDVHAGGLGRIEDVRHVHEDGDVLAHAGLLCGAVPGVRRVRVRMETG